MKRNKPTTKGNRNHVVYFMFFALLICNWMKISKRNKQSTWFSSTAHTSPLISLPPLLTLHFQELQLLGYYIYSFVYFNKEHFLSSNNIIMWFFFLFFFIRSKYNGIEWKRDFDRIKEERNRTTHSIPISCSWVKWMKRNGITRQRGVRYSFTLTLFAFLFISLHTTQRGNWKGMEWK